MDYLDESQQIEEDAVAQEEHEDDETRVKLESKYVLPPYIAGEIPMEPPRIPTKKYVIFGKPYDPTNCNILSLKDQSVEEVDLSFISSFKEKLSTIHKAILLNYIDLLGIIINNPNHDSKIEKINKISTLFINMHHIINTMREKQAVETIKQITCKKIQDYNVYSEQLEKICDDNEKKLLNIETILENT